MSKDKKKKPPLDKMHNKLEDVADLAEKMTTEVEKRKNPDLAELAAELKYIRYLREVWVGNVDRYTAELESAIVSAMTSDRKKAA